MENMPAIKPGQRTRFDPFESLKGYGTDTIRRTVTGTVVYVNEARGWFSVEYEGQRTSYRFDDIGKEVKVV